jgi:lipid A ethanolaminephosphotransferase
MNGPPAAYLHGIPYAIAPQSQLKVPMIVWLSPELSSSRGIDGACLRRRAARAAARGRSRPLRP